MRVADQSPLPLAPQMGLRLAVSVLLRPTRTMLNAEDDDRGVGTGATEEDED